MERKWCPYCRAGEFRIRQGAATYSVPNTRGYTESDYDGSDDSATGPCLWCFRPTDNETGMSLLGLPLCGFCEVGTKKLMRRIMLLCRQNGQRKGDLFDGLLLGLSRRSSHKSEPE
jgi:hypothetical protein